MEVLSIRAAELTQVGAVRNRAADRVDHLVADNQVEIGAIRSERVISGRTNVRASLPPAVLSAHDIRRKCVIQPRTRPIASCRCLDVYPVARADAALGRSRRMHLDLRIERAPSQTRQRPMLALAEQG